MSDTTREYDEAKIYEAYLLQLERMVLNQKNTIQHYRKENHAMRGLLQTACDAAETNGPWSALHPAWFEEAERITDDEPEEREGEG